MPNLCARERRAENNGAAPENCCGGVKALHDLLAFQ
jgi:hypothetical protein